MEPPEDGGGDGDYTVTADMLIHDDVDDERTLAEEEEDECDDNYEDELVDLQKDQDLPLEDLLAMYYSNTSVAVGNNPTDKSTSPIHNPPDLLLPPGLLEDSEQDKPPPKVDTSTRQGTDPKVLTRLRPVPERRSMKLYTEDGNALIDSTFNRWLCNNDNGSSSDEDSSNGSGWQKEIKVGNDHQANVPSSCQPYSKENNACASDVLLWQPGVIPENEVRNYLANVNNLLEMETGLPCGSCDRDNEHALHLLQSCDHNVIKAEEQYRKNTPSQTSVMSNWSTEDCQRFESGLTSTGKDFYLLQKQLPERSIKELIDFYYFWKKTERYDAFIQQGRLGKKKFSVPPPGYLSDFMDEYLKVAQTDCPELHYATTTLSAEVKKEKYSTHSDDRLGHAHNTKSIATRIS